MIPLLLGCPCFIANGSPTFKSGMITVQETPKHQFNDAFAPDLIWAFEGPSRFLPVQLNFIMKKEQNQVCHFIDFVYKGACRESWWTHRDWLGINACAAFVSTQTSHARFRLLIVEQGSRPLCVKK